MLRTFTANRYHPPEVLSLSLSDDPNGDSDGVLVTSTVGGATATLTGTNLGGDLLASRVTWNGVPVPGVRMGTPHTSLVFSVPPGPGGPVVVGVEVGGQSAVVVPGVTLPVVTYRAPTLGAPSLYDSTDPFECSRTSSLAITGGNATLLLVGSDFGDGSATVVYVVVWISLLSRYLADHSSRLLRFVLSYVACGCQDCWRSPGVRGPAPIVPQ